MSENTLYDKIWDSHKVATLPTGQDQMFVGLHLIHEVTSPQAFAMLREGKGKVAFPHLNFATADHIIPTKSQARPFADDQAEQMMSELEKNVAEFGVSFFDLGSGNQGIVHVIGPELGLTHPGTIIACGDSHTATHGAFGSLAFGIGTTEVRNVLETQTLALNRSKVHRINFDGNLDRGTYAKDVILYIIQKLGVKGGIGFTYEYGGEVFDRMSMEQRMSVCNMSIEGGARAGYVNPDNTTFKYLKGRKFVTSGPEWEKAVAYWKSTASGSDARYDKTTNFSAKDLEPIVTWGVNPGQSIGISGRIPRLNELPDDERKTAEEAYAHMGVNPGDTIYNTPIDVAFVGSCTNGRIEDLRETARILEGKKVASSVRMIVVPGSQLVKKQAEDEGIDKIISASGAEWRGAGCSMCLAMNPDKLNGSERSISATNRNFIGRQGSAKGRTHLASPATVAASAIAGYITDSREYR
jgi:3-isopropylmalate/(R)-2-methylmalate dehydratase large subunit